MELNPHLKFKLNFAAIKTATVLFTFLMAIVESSPIVFESDILIEGGIDKLENSLSNSETKSITRIKRAATANKNHLWEFGIIPYIIDENAGFDSSQKAEFRLAMDYWESVSCIKFVERNANEHDNFIHFTVSTTCGCCSSVGKQGNGGQNVYITISKGCLTQYVILHELGHVIGFWHEHSRPDRDEFIRIQRKFIKSGVEYAFDKLPAKYVNSLGEPYDFDSIMHYAPNAFSIDPYDLTKSTIQAKRGKNGQIPKFGGSHLLSPGDIRQTNKLYKCSECGHTLHNQEATFSSPTDHTKFDKPFRCEWHISVMHGAIIQLRLNIDIIISTNCKSNYIEIRDGYSNKSPLLGRLCGVHNNISIMSTGNHMLIYYVTDKQKNRGFAARYKSFFFTL